MFKDNNLILIYNIDVNYINQIYFKISFKTSETDIAYCIYYDNS